MATETTYVADVTYTHNGKCFNLATAGVIELNKGAKNELSIRNESDEPLSLVYVVDKATKKNGSPVQVGKVKPFEQRELDVDPRTTGSFILKNQMGLGDKGDIHGSLHPQGGCPHIDVIRSHTEWHIEC